MAVSTAGVRDYLKGLGVDNSRIGWNERDKYVTLDGQYLLTPESVKDGVSYRLRTPILASQARKAGIDYESERVLFPTGKESSNTSELFS